MTGEEWLVKKVGAYLPGAYEEVVDVVEAYVLTNKVGTGTFSSLSSITSNEVLLGNFEKGERRIFIFFFPLLIFLWCVITAESATHASRSHIH